MNADRADSLTEYVDHFLHASMAKMTLGLSPAAVGGAYFDWLTHLLASPGKQLDLAIEALGEALNFGNYVRSASIWPSVPPLIDALPQDRRFTGDEWRRWPYNAFFQGFLLTQQWWQSATTNVRGVSRHHEAMAQFGARQLLDVFSPSNFLPTNPQLFDFTLRRGGTNLIAGLQHFAEDCLRSAGHQKPVGSECFEVGKNLAATPGKVVFRNHLVELIQYLPTTGKARPEPILIVPAWIMKYYILDLSREDSLVRYLVDQGFTVFMISWKNPHAEDRDLSMEDYRVSGVMAAVDAVTTIIPTAKIHAVGYCLGGTLLSIAAAAMSRDGDSRLATLSFFAAQTDFSEAGELTLFIDESQIAFLEDMMWEQGVLDASQMAGAFRLLRSNDLLWSYGLRSYLFGERPTLNDLMAWNADATRLPYRMHSQYLRQLFLNNDLAEGRYIVEDKPVALADIHLPIFAVGTEWDHVAPWRSTYKIHLLTEADVTYVLTAGGHNAGIVSPVDRLHRWYRTGNRRAGGAYVDPDTWFDTAPRCEGSWWPHFVHWLSLHSGTTSLPPAIGGSTGALGDAPGTFVFES